MSDIQDFKILLSKTFLWFSKENITQCMGGVGMCLPHGLLCINTPG
jgi:hypothetical protein